MWTLAELLEATGGELHQAVPAGQFDAVRIDSRAVHRGDIFVAIRGHRFDGHVFVGDAVSAGAGCVIVERGTAIPSEAARVSVIFVPDTIASLAALARFHRRKLKPTVVAVTGSCGKTTTKDLIAHLLGGEAEVLKSQGTQNNHIGVPMTLLSLQPRHRLAIVEMGTNHPGEIASLAAIAEPDVAVITNVGPAHLEFLGSIEGVMREKLSLLDKLPATGCAVLPGNQLDVCLEALQRLPAGVRVVTAGTTDGNDLQAVEDGHTSQGVTMRLRDLPHTWQIPLFGAHNVENALMAVACAWALGVPLSVARARLASATVSPQRSEIVRCGSMTILNDCYNANPLSVARALETLRDMDVERRIAVVGDMLELGDFAPSAHEAVGRMASRFGIHTVLAVGQFAECVASGARDAAFEVSVFETVDDLLGRLAEVVRPGDGILVKGSRKLQLERVTSFLLERDAKSGGQSPT